MNYGCGGIMHWIFLHPLFPSWFVAGCLSMYHHAFCRELQASAQLESEAKLHHLSQDVRCPPFKGPTMRLHNEICAVFNARLLFWLILLLTEGPQICLNHLRSWGQWLRILPCQRRWASIVPSCVSGGESRVQSRRRFPKTLVAPWLSFGFWSWPIPSVENLSVWGQQGPVSLCYTKRELVGIAKYSLGCF